MIPQLALHLYKEEEKKKPRHHGHTYAMFEKYDGWYGYRDTNGPICSRKCREIPSLAKFSKEIMFTVRGRLIFEILLSDIDDFHTMNGVLNRSKGECEAKTAYLRVHDFIPLGCEEMPFFERYESACKLVYAINNPRVIMAPKIGVHHRPEVWKNCVDQIWYNGGEGIILKRTDAPYSPGKRTFDLMKIKEEVTLDLVVIGMAIGEGKYADTLGSLIVSDKSGNHHNVSGMSDPERFDWWDCPAKIIGKVVEVKAMKKLKDGTLREPRFKAVRFDKTVQDID